MRCGRPVHRGGLDPKVTPCYAQSRESEGKVSAWTQFFRGSRGGAAFSAAKLGATADLLLVDIKHKDGCHCDFKVR
jgi:hypothetical protein